MTSKSQADSALTQASLANISADKSAGATPVYEVGYILVPTLSVAEAEEVASKIRALVGKEVLKEEAPRNMSLAYVIERSRAGKREKYGEGYFGFIKFESEKEPIPAIAEALRNNQSVLRYLLIETVREDINRRAVFASDRLEGETIKKPQAAVEEKVEVSEEELDKSIDALVG
jgi:ribosomal protein S6